MNPAKAILQNNYFRFGITFILCLLYSLLRETVFSTLVKPLPIIFWLLITVVSERNQINLLVIISLCFAFTGDILLNLGDQWLRIGAIPFLMSTSILAWAFHLRLRQGQTKANHVARGLLFVIIAIVFMFLYRYIVSQSSEAAMVGAVLFFISVFLLWTALSNALFNTVENRNIIRSILGFIGACGIVANYVLYSLDLYVVSINRDLVIQVYYWGTAFVAWSFLGSSQ